MLLKLDTLFPLLFPQHDLVGKNHRAMNDAQQLRLVTKKLEQYCFREGDLRNKNQTLDSWIIRGNSGPHDGESLETLLLATEEPGSSFKTPRKLSIKPILNPKKARQLKWQNSAKGREASLRYRNSARCRARSRQKLALLATIAAGRATIKRARAYRRELQRSTRYRN